MKRAAFTLVELSIVLVILGLLVGGVLAGQSLIRASELRAVMSEYTKIMTGVHAFRDKYFALPGDMPNATRYWGAQTGATTDGTVSACVALTTAATGIATCNGDGNGVVGNLIETKYHERFRGWQHLANAGLMEGTFSGVQGSGGVAHVVIGTNAPRSKITGGGWSMTGMGATYSSANMYSGYYPNLFFTIGGQLADTTATGLIFKPEEAYNIDMKMDDGKPHQGHIIGYKYGSTYAPNCSVSTDDAYALSRSSSDCFLLFKAPI